MSQVGPPQMHYLWQSGGSRTIAFLIEDLKPKEPKIGGLAEGERGNENSITVEFRWKSKGEGHHSGLVVSMVIL